MSNSTYLVALALIDQNGERSMPLGGKSLPQTCKTTPSHQEKRREIILELLIRIFQRLDENVIRTKSSNKSLLLIEISFEKMHQEIPLIKSNWLKNGETDLLINKLKELSEKIWSVTFTKGEGVIFKAL